MFKKAFVVLVSTLIIVLTLHAQDDASMLPEPDEAMAQMDWFVGEWEVTSRYLLQSGDWFEESGITSINTYELNGNIIFENVIGPLFGGPFEAWSIRTYNANTGQWEQRWVDTFPGGFADYTGSWDEDAGEFIGYSNTSLDEDGELKEMAFREVFFNITEDSFSWRQESSEDGGETWNVNWELDYSRTSE